MTAAESMATEATLGLIMQKWPDFIYELLDSGP